MNYPLELDGFDGHEVAVESQGIIRQPRILFDGAPAEKGPQKGQYILPRDDGLKLTVEVRPRPFDAVPKVLVDGRQIELARSLDYYEVLWSALPVLLVFFGGLVGGLIAGIAFWINLKVFRSDIQPVEQYVLSGAVSAIALFLYLIFFFMTGSVAVANQ